MRCGRNLHPEGKYRWAVVIGGAIAWAASGYKGLPIIRNCSLLSWREIEHVQPSPVLVTGCIDASIRVNLQVWFDGGTPFFRCNTDVSDSMIRIRALSGIMMLRLLQSRLQQLYYRFDRPIGIFFARGNSSPPEKRKPRKVAVAKSSLLLDRG